MSNKETPRLARGNFLRIVQVHLTNIFLKWNKFRKTHLESLGLSQNPCKDGKLKRTCRSENLVHRDKVHHP